MKKQTSSEAVQMLLTDLVMMMLTYFLVNIVGHFWNMDFRMFLLLICLLACACSAGMTFYLKKRNKRRGIELAVLVVVVLVLFVLYLAGVFGEGGTFYALYVRICCYGLLLGHGLGSWIWYGYWKKHNKI